MRILVTGSRDWESKGGVLQELRRYAPARKITLVSGFDPDARKPSGVDMFAYDYASSRPDYWDVDNFIPNWDRKCDEFCYHPRKFKVIAHDILVPYCPVAGHLRNQEMVDSGADIALVFYKKGAKNKGTLDCSRRCKKAGIQRKIIWELQS